MNVLPRLGSEMGTEQLLNDFILKGFFCPKWPWGCHLGSKGGGHG